ncbi:MAG: tRNA pseudouridine(38-40) synthase TruA [Candidatus Omnitrophota bacterium]
MRLPGRNIKLEIEYDGTNFCGWQKQKSKVGTGLAPVRKVGAGRDLSVVSQQKKAIQEVIEETICQIIQERVKLIASGRTDSGVHAKAQIANFHCLSAININNLHQAINALLPDDIAVKYIEEVPLDFHSRFNARSKVYRYSILNRKYHSPILRNYVYFFRYPLDLKLMRQEAETITGKHDFKAFCASGSKVKDTVRTVKNIIIKRFVCPLLTVHCKLIIIDIEADGFLYNMARNIAGTLIEIGRGRFKEGSLKKILLSKNRNLAGPTAPAKGLCLMEVKYCRPARQKKENLF